MAKSYKVKRGSRSSKKRGRHTKRRIYRGGSPGCGSCSSNLLKGGSRRKRGGDFNKSILAYTGKPSGNMTSPPNPYLAYTGKPSVNLANAYPNPGQTPSFMNWLNPSQTQKGGKYPNGLTGDPWTPSAQTWPGVNGVDSDNNHFELNNYNNDVSRQMVDVGPAAPYTVGGRRRRRKGKRTRSRKGGNGASISPGNNSLFQDAANVGRQLNSSLGGVYNALNGFPPPVNPLPWKGQLMNTNSNNMNYLKYQ